jgi:uncharacterized protein
VDTEEQLARAQAEINEFISRRVQERKARRERERQQWRPKKIDEGTAEASARAAYPLYLRFGEPPKTGRSNTYRRELFALANARGDRLRMPLPNADLEKGVSVFRACRDEDGSYVVDTSPDTQCAKIFALLSDSGRPAYLVEGREVGFGHLGEPLLTDVRILVRLASEAPNGDPLVRGSEPLGFLPSLFSLPNKFKAAVTGRRLDMTTQGQQAALLPYHTEASRRSRIHGRYLALRVADRAIKLCDKTEGADPHVAVLFGLWHDSQRQSDGRDPEHGRRAAGKVKFLGRHDLFDATDEQAALLEEACAGHVDGLVTEDPTIGVCWDADRLDLGRCRITPDPAYLSTEAAKASL